jgi:nucleotide-binding universal stress UspA family protein
VEYAEENNCDLILMATRGLTGLEHLLIGSTTERVVRLAKCPVLTLERD